jgi:tetratricopeptide (TPR) repeat protein
VTRKDEVRQLPRWKRVVFSLAPTIAILLVLVGIELALRLTPPPANDALVTEMSFDGTAWLQTNRAWLARYFPSSAAVVPEFKTFLFRKEKLPHTFRVICLGSSSMFGTPYDMNANIPGILRRQLRHRYPDLEWEVLNFGASAINSNVVRDLAPELLAFKPDLVLIYMGHNEYYGPDGIGASLPERIFPSLTPLKYKARRLRTVQAVQRWFASAPSVQDAPRNLMQQVSAGQHVDLQSTESGRALGRFGENLDAILTTFDDAHVPVIVSDIASNLTFPPFVTDSVIGGRNAAAFDAQMRGLASQGQFDAVLRETDGLGGRASRHPLAMYWKGMALRSLGHPGEALPLLIDARDNDLLKFRAPSAVDSIIHATARRHGTLCISADTLLRRASPDGIAGDDLFWEHLHPTPAGYYCIASGFLDAIVRSGVVRSASAATPAIPFNTDSLHICWLDLAYGDLSIQHLTGRWPFETYERKPLVLGQAEQRLLDLVRNTHARKLAWNDACYRSATMFWRMGRLQEALTTYQAMLEEYPYSFYTNYLAGNLLNTMGRGEEAVGYLRTSIRSNPEYLPAHLDLGLLAVNAGRYTEGEEHLRYVVQHAHGAPEDLRMRANALYGLGAGALNRGDAAAAMKAVTEALAVAPGYPDALRLQATIRGVAPGIR